METHLAGVLYPGTRADIIAYLQSVGYSHLETDSQPSKDDLFVRKDVWIRRDEL